MSPVTTAPPALTAADAQPRHQYLAEVLDLLYPAPCSLTGEGPDRVAEYLVVPHARKPKVLIPVGSRRVAAAAVRRFAEPHGRMGKLKRDAVVAALRTGAWPALLRDRVRINAPAPGTDSIDAYLQRSLGDQLSISIHIGPARANRKPVLQLLAGSGRTFGFAKLGTGPLTRRLVRAETAALTALSHIALGEVAVPTVLYESARVLIDRYGDIPLTFGAWHGDWSPWNMANVSGDDHSPDKLLVWGWERFTLGVPMGFDALHHELQRRVQAETDARACVRDLVTQAPTLLDPFDVVPDGREATALLYLVDLAARYLGDRQAEAGARLGVLGTWLLPVLIDRVGRLA